MSPSGNNLSYRFEIVDSSQIGEARRFAIQLAHAADFDEVSSGRVSIVINELCTNLLKHAHHGEIVMQLNRSADHLVGLEILSLDRGPGIPDLALCFQDGYSTSATAGTGLGAVRRQSDICDIYTNDKGTVVLSAIYNHRDQAPLKNFYFGGICLPIHGETVSGDGWSYRDLGQQKMVLLADGLGHGLLAHEASHSAIDSFNELNGQEELSLAMNNLHLRLKSTRGAAVALARLDFDDCKLNYLSIGNVRTALLSADRTENLISHAGTLGLQLRMAKPVVAQLAKETLIVMYSDGLHQRWDLRSYPGLMQRHPAVICGVLFRDFFRGTDDVTVLAGGWLQ